MAGKPKSMSQIKQLLQLHQQGKGKREIARILGISKNTVKTYLTKLDAGTMDISALLSLDDPVLNSKFHAGNPSYKEERYEYLKSKQSYYLKELNRAGVTKHLLWEEYKDVNPLGYGYSQFCFHLEQHGKATRPSMVLSHIAGDKLFIDYAGKTLSYIDTATGEEIKCQVFVACLPYSDFCFAMAVRSQSVADFIYALTCCLNAIGGAPKALVPDNLKSAVIKANSYEPHINKALDDFANHYQTTVVPARVRKPQDKALVENQVKLIYSRVYAKIRNQQFFSLQALNTSISEHIKAHNQTRMQRKEYCREEKFLAGEKHLLTPLPVTTYELKHYKEYKVAQNNHIYLAQDKHYYSVPYVHTNSQVTVIYTRSKVCIYAAGECVAIHPRDYGMGKYSTLKQHLCSTHQHYMDRSPDYYLQKAKDKSSGLYQLFDVLFQQNRYPEQQYRTCDGLLRLQRNSDPAKFEKACSMAIEYQKYSYTFVSNILKNNMVDASVEGLKTPLPEHYNIRGKEYFNPTHLNLN